MNQHPASQHSHVAAIAKRWSHVVCSFHALAGAATFLLLVSASFAKIPEPDAIYYGTAKHNGGSVVLYPSGSEMVVMAKLNGVQIASAAIQPNGKFVLKVPVDDGQEPRLPGMARGNERIRIYLRNTTSSLEAEVNQSLGLGVLVPALRGDLSPVDFAVTLDLGGLPPPPEGYFGFMAGYGLSGTPDTMGQDSDGDGQSNLQEFITQTDPTNGMDNFRIMETHRLNGITSIKYGPIKLSREYSIWCSEDLSGANWQKIGTIVPNAPSGFRWFDHASSGEANLFYKLTVDIQ